MKEKQSWQEFFQKHGKDEEERYRAFIDRMMSERPPSVLRDYNGKIVGVA